MEDRYIIENFKDKQGTLDLSDFYYNLSHLFPSLELQELPLVDGKTGGMISNPTLINFYSFGENKSLTVIYKLNTVFGANCRRIEDAIQNPRTIEKIELIPQNMDFASQTRLEKLVNKYK